MPLKSGSSRDTISSNISELHGGNTYAKTSAKFGKEKANKQAVAIAFSKAREGKGAKSAAKPKGPGRKGRFGPVGSF